MAFEINHGKGFEGEQGGWAVYTCVKEERLSVS